MSTLVDQIAAKVLLALGVTPEPPGPAPMVCSDPEALVGRYAVVTTDSRDIWYGKILRYDGRVVSLAGARNVFYYAANPTHENEKGIGSLATVGPVVGSKIGPAVTTASLRNVSAILVCTEAAAAAFAATGWSK